MPNHAQKTYLSAKKTKTLLDPITSSDINGQITHWLGSNAFWSIILEEKSSEENINLSFILTYF